MALLSGVVSSSANVSFDDSTHTFQSPEGSEAEDTIPPLMHLPPPPPPATLSRHKGSHDSQEDSQFESPEEDVKSASSLDILETQSDSACSMEKLSPNTVGSEDADEVRNNNNNNNNFTVSFSKFKESGLSYYYQNIITKQVMLVSNN